MTIELIRQLLRYEPETGLLYWTEAQTSAFRGKPAGTPDAYGYVNLSVKRKRYKAHRVAWLLFYGSWPSGQIDHVDGDKANNRISNLREASNQSNQWNQRKAQVNSKVGLRGVCKHRDKFMAGIKVSGKNIYLGLFDTPELAHQAYLAAKAIHHPGAVHA